MAELDVLVIGSGGREYELARQASLSPKVGKVYVTPGNGGTAVLDKCENVAIGPTEVEKLVALAKEKNVGLAVLGMDAAVEAGAGDALREAGVLVFGPNRSAGRLEWSKSFAAEFMERHGIPHPKSLSFHKLEEALEHITDRAPNEYVIKADGLAVGKGVVLPSTNEEADETLREMFSGTKFEGAGKDTVVIQERLGGPEVSAFAVTDGKDFVLLPLSQDYKRIHDGDEGPNTGGMGSYAPVPESIVNADTLAKIKKIVEQTIQGMAEENNPYQGVLYIGLMLAEQRAGDPVVIEYNARFGDPEAEVLLPILSESGVDAADMMLHAARGELNQVNVPEKFDKEALTVALATPGYPENPVKGAEIFGLDKKYEGVIIQHAGTKNMGGDWLTNGGRVVYVTGFGKDVDEAAEKAYAAIGDQGIHFEKMQYRRDIGHQARKNK